MLIDLLGAENYVSYNVKIAEILGLNCAVYLAELVNINEKAIKKNKVENKFFTIDRKYIEKRTTLNRAEQLKLDATLQDLGIITVSGDKNNTLQLNISAIITLLNGDNENIVAELTKMQAALNRNANKVGTKEQQQCELMKTYITAENPELYQAYCDWIDSVYAKLHWMSKKAVEVAQREIDKYSDHNLDVALGILELATVNGYKDISWAIKAYDDNYEVSYRVKYSRSPEKQTQEKVELGEEVF